jgi:hypothetical protein
MGTPAFGLVSYAPVFFGFPSTAALAGFFDLIQSAVRPER